MYTNLNVPFPGVGTQPRPGCMFMARVLGVLAPIALNWAWIAVPPQQPSYMVRHVGRAVGGNGALSASSSVYHDVSVIAMARRPV